MSMQRGCLIVEIESGKWYAFVAQAEHDYDFRTFNSYGPVASENAAWDKVSENESNPGGGNVLSHDKLDDDGRARFRAMLATSPPRSNRRYSHWN